MVIKCAAWIPLKGADSLQASELFPTKPCPSLQATTSPPTPSASGPVMTRTRILPKRSRIRFYEYFTLNLKWAKADFSGGSVCATSLWFGFESYDPGFTPRKFLCVLFEHCLVLASSRSFVFITFVTVIIYDFITFKP